MNGRVNVHSPFGVVNMIGNALELTQKGYGRGGSFNTPVNPKALASSYVIFNASGRAEAGFRCVK